MRMRYFSLLLFLFFGIGNALIQAQNTILTNDASSSGDNLIAFPIADRTLSFSVSDSGVYKPIIWGLDLAWLDEVNIRRGMAYMGKERVDVVRSSFMPTQPLNNGKLQGDALTNTNKRIQIINKWLSNSTKVVLNCDHPSVHAYYKGNAKNWAELIDVTARMHQEAGRDVVTVSPFNEPDYSATGQGTIQDFYNIIFELKKNSRFDTIRISGGNTLNNDVALTWYNVLNSAGLDEGNTHQLAGSFDTYASFFKAVRANSDHATNDELHNVMEAMVGVEYGLQTGIWWGTAELARGEFVKASDGKRLGYAEHRPNWTAASVYRNPAGKVQAFVGSSERQAATTTYHFFSKERDVFYNGHGPQREFIVEIPGGTGYQQGQTNAETVVNITWGDDIQPVIDGKYILVNRNSGKVMEVANGSTANGTGIKQNAYNGATYQQWNVNPVNPRHGGDFSYFTISGAASGKHLDINNSSLENGGVAILWEKGKWWDGRQSLNQVWYLEYAEDGWFYVRNQFSAKCLEVANNSTANGGIVQQYDLNGGYNQQWRFMPVGAPVEFDAPSAPVQLVARANAESVRLNWTANTENDLAGYAIFRAESKDGPYHTLARNIKTTAFVDNTCTKAVPYFYKIKAVDKSLNSSAYSEVVTATTNGDSALVMSLQFDGNLLDSTINLNHSASFTEATFVAGIVGSQSIALNGTSNFLQLPFNVANQKEITVAAWVYWNGGTPWQRIFDFGNGETEYMNLTPKMRFAIKNGGAEQRLDASALPEGKWVHVAVTLGTSGARLYKNGELVNESTEITIRPIDFKPLLNYIGRAQTTVPFFNGLVDDFRIYNFELTTEEIARLVSDVNTSVQSVANRNGININVYPIPAGDFLRYDIDTRNNGSIETLSLYNTHGDQVFQQDLKNKTEGEINSSVLPSGIYLLKVSGRNFISSAKIVIKH